jgi:hypothetical protein
MTIAMSISTSCSNGSAGSGIYKHSVHQHPLQQRMIFIRIIHRCTVITQVTDKNQNYLVSGICPSSGILNTRNSNVWETGSVSVLRWRERGAYSIGSLDQWLRLALSRRPNRVDIFPSPYLRTETDPVCETLFSIYLEFRTMDNTKTQ